MGEHGVRAQPSDLLPNGLLPNQVVSVTRVLNMERWSKAEKRTAELMPYIQPDQPSEEHRNAVANYVQLLITKCFACQVFTFGSVPLKTYLPDGDIDLTACSDNENLKDTWASAVREALENEGNNENAEFHIREVQYIQAEVKLIKCLVDNIVVDISFNQVGGLCTLCFLEEVDDLINQNHLFKRSIILIKAWCYYESRVLGAHHGLISTYALEILVLYIFHVFNNAFAGPLEVLYRFLEFFSNFDWDNFCVSLWGPVPISSLPDMIAEMPRKDNGKLFLNEDFLHGCSQRYSAIPREQESRAQSFVSKYFNVVDPLRTNNNLGRSVSKGNFFRIRSAFAFGAKRLTRLLECPMDDIIAEVNQFFMNTWGRHGSGHRPDFPGLNLRHLQVANGVPVDKMKNTKNVTNIKKKRENAPINIGPEPALGTVHDQDSKLEIKSATRENTQKNYGTSNSNSSVVSDSHQKYSSGQTNSRVFDQSEGNTTSNGSVHSDKSQKMLKPINSLVEEGQDRFQFTRTRSTPELAQAVPGFSRGRRSRATETRKTEDPSAGVDFTNRIDTTSTLIRESPSIKTLEVVSDMNISSKSSNNFHHDFDFSTMSEELASVSEALDMQQEEQDFINMMDTSSTHMFNGQVHLPAHVASHFPLALSPAPTPIGFTQRSWAGVYPPTLSLIGSSWGSNMQFSPGLVPAPFSPYFHDSTPRLNENDAVEFVNEVSLTTELNLENNDRSIWQENDAGTSRSFNSDDNSRQMLHLDSKQRKTHYGLNQIHTSRTTDSGAVLLGQNKFSRERGGAVIEDESDLFQNRKGRGTDPSSNSRGANMRSFSASQINKSKAESFSDGSIEKAPKLVRDKWERKPVFSSAVTSSSGRSNSGSRCENLSDEGDDETTSWMLLSSEETYMAERVAVSSTSISGNTRNQLHSLESTQISGPDQLIPFTQVFVSSSRQSRGDNPNVLPVTFFPTGPPFPFVMVPVPLYGSTAASQFERVDEVDHGGASSSDPKMDSVETFDHADILLTSPASVMSKPESSDEHRLDILNSDRNSHWQNLEYGRLCQNSQSHGPIPFVVPPLNLQGRIPCDGQGRPISANLNLTQVIGYGPRLLPMMPLQSVSDRVSGGFQRYGEEAPRYRGGTGTYLPNPKVSPRQRQSSSRNPKWNYSNDRHDLGNSEGSWISSKQRSSDRGEARNQEKSSSRPEKVAATDNHVDVPWESYRNIPISSYLAHNSSFGPLNSSHGSSNIVGTNKQPVLAPNIGVTVGPTSPFLMVHSCDQGNDGGALVEPLEFGSLGPVQLLKDHVAPPVMGDGIAGAGTRRQRHATYSVGSQRPSSAQPTPLPLKR
ncbi:hypothetical protein Cni_G07156 [Canna indica]|uniref:Polymerase nucleotidyl transferase domain-containing protein n=1 Tax=Canna indica TaxID=4628 RepID=A0AAQ3JZX0_9LILI|nr:hypothetical protein Cni_G07156 [Canna indica]